METMQPTLRIGRCSWDRVNMPVSEFLERMEKIRAWMKIENVDVLLVYGNGFDAYGDYCYLSNFVIRLPRGAMMIIPREGSPALLFEGASRGIPSVRRMTWVEDIRACSDISKECARYLEEKKLVPSKLGIVGLRSLMPYGQWRFLSGVLSRCDAVDMEHILREMRMTKSSREIDQIRRASRILRQIFETVASDSRLWLNERELGAVLYREARLEGAEDVRLLVGRSRDGKWRLRPIEDSAVPRGEILTLYVAVCFERYWSEAIRTFSVGNGVLKIALPEEVESSYEAIWKFAKSGLMASEIYRQAMKVIRQGGFEHINDYGIGQGIGLSLQEPPSLAEGDETLLAKGTTLSLRLLVKAGGTGFATGDTFVITEKGPEKLTG